MTHVILVAIVLALLPISEVRGAIPLVLTLIDNQLLKIIGVASSVIANMAVPLIGYLILSLLERLILSGSTPLLIKRVYEKILNYGRKRALSLQNTSYIALIFFVGVPLPFTGAWTGTLIAYILGLDKRKSILAINLGVIIASLIVIVGSVFGIELLKWLFTW